jgi:hypothetical protein
MVADVIGREIKVGDYVEYHSLVYHVLQVIPKGASEVKMMLVKKSKSTKAKMAYSKHVCLLPTDATTFWLLAQGAKS